MANCLRKSATHSAVVLCERPRSRGPAAGVEGRVDQKFDLELRGAAGGGVRAWAFANPYSLTSYKSPGLRVHDD